MKIVMYDAINFYKFVEFDYILKAYQKSRGKLLLFWYTENSFVYPPISI